jgi:hypothetical protein
MRKIETYACSNCDDTFDNEYECNKHEETCGKSIINTCDKCGCQEDVGDDEYGWKSEGWYPINLGRPGYGSGLDGCDVAFLLCDDCLINFIQSFTVEGQEKVFNSGSNQYLSTEDWIRVEKGEMPDEEMEEKHMYSPRQIKAYEEQFPICDKVKIVEYKDGSRGSNCPLGAFGDEYGNCGLNPSTSCFNCEMYNKRHEGEKIDITHNEHY